MSFETLNFDKLKNDDRELAPLETEANKLLAPFDRFFRNQASTGVLLLIAASLALTVANSSYSAVYESINHLPLTVALGEWQFSHSLRHWVNDGLMVLFFFVIGLEVKREILVGDLSEISHSALVIFMAVGGMVLPALIYAIITQESSAMLSGWGIPMATDAAFALGILAVLGSHAPRSAALLLSALAIIDDIGAVLVIGLFYTESINFNALIWAGMTFLSLVLMNLMGIRKGLAYLIGGFTLWIFILQSGIHATTAGILTAMAVPTRPYATTDWFSNKMKSLLHHYKALDEQDKSILEVEPQQELVEQAEKIAIKTCSPLHRWTNVIDKPVSFLILPLFAFLNAGVLFPTTSFSFSESIVTTAIMAGLLLGKICGISLFAWAGLKLGVAKMPKEIHFIHLIGIASLAGIGFTMSIFVATLAFESLPQLLTQAKLGILGASIIAGVTGVGIFLWASHTRKNDQVNATEQSGKDN